MASMFFFTGRGIQVEEEHPLASVPKNAAVIFKSKNFLKLYRQLSETNLMWQELLHSEYFSTLDSNGALIDSLLRSKPEIANLLEENPLYVSIHRSGKGKFSVLYSVSLPLTEEEMLTHIPGFYLNVEESRVIDKGKIHTLKSVNGGEPLYLTLNQSVLNLSHNVVLIEDALNQLNSGNGLLDDPSFKSVLSTSGKYVDANVFIQYSTFNEVVASFLNPEIGNDYENISHFAEWAALDLLLKPNALMFNGFTKTPDSASSYLQCFEGQEAQDLDMLAIIPERSSSMVCAGISNFSRYHHKYKSWLNRIGKSKSYDDAISSANKEFKLEIDEEFPDVIGNELGYFYFDDGNDSQKETLYAAIRSSNHVDMLALLDRISINVNENDERQIGKLRAPGVVENYLGLGESGQQLIYWVSYDPYVVFSASIEGIREYVNYRARGRMLSEGENFTLFDDNLSTKSSLFIYSNFYRSANLYQSLFSKDWTGVLENHRGMLTKFEAVAMQFIARPKDLFYQNVYLNYNPVLKKESKSLWETVLDTVLATRPFTVINHYTNAKEIFVQDAHNKLYLLDNKGNILWTKNINERIISKVKQIDIYKNNKLQLLFNTASKLYLIDRKGRHVEGYPVKIPGGASCGLTLIDYEQNRNYRILIPTNDKKVLNYSGSGNVVKGWKMKSTSSVVTSPVKYFALNGKDYIISVDEKGKVYVVNRRGESRIKIDEKLPIRNGHDFHLEIHRDINLCGVVATDSTGKVVKITMDDQKQVVELDSLSAGHYFEYQDINNDKGYEYIFLDSLSLKCYKQDKSLLFEVEFESPVYSPVIYISNMSKYGKFGIVDKANSRIYLYHDAGGLDEDFPISGTGAFIIDDINSDGANDVIVGVNDAVVTYSLTK